MLGVGVSLWRGGFLDLLNSRVAKIYESVIVQRKQIPLLYIQHVKYNIIYFYKFTFQDTFNICVKVGKTD